MQTFLPYPDFKRSARVLDMKRLGKQRVETMQIMSALVKLQAFGQHTTNVPWGKHPATLMWLGYEGALMDYQEAICKEWTGRGYNDTCYAKTGELYVKVVGPDVRNWTGDRPEWLNLKRFHIPHRANLIRKDPVRYGKLWPEIEPQEGYWWPGEGYKRP